MSIDVKKHLYGTPDYFEQIALGTTPNKKFIYKFGRNGSVGATETLISSGGVYGLPSTAETVSVISDDVANDNPTGNGARTIHIFGLDENYDEIDEIVSVGSTTIQAFLRIFRCHVETTGTRTPIGGANFGTITITQSTSLIDMIVLEPNVGQSLTACYTIPNGFNGYIWSADVTTGEGKNAISSLKSRDFYSDSAFLTKGIRDNFENSTEQRFKIPTLYEEKADIVFTTVSSASGTPVSGSFLIELIEKPK